eukprot:1782996-Rhodomonas_salina.1
MKVLANKNLVLQRKARELRSAHSRVLFSTPCHAGAPPFPLICISSRNPPNLPAPTPLLSPHAHSFLCAVPHDHRRLQVLRLEEEVSSLEQQLALSKASSPRSRNALADEHKELSAQLVEEEEATSAALQVRCRIAADYAPCLLLTSR